MTPRKSPSSQSHYDSQYEREKKKILRHHADEDLYNEIELLRYMNLVVLQRMKVDARQLSYPDYIATLRAITHSSARIAYILKAQYHIFSPLSTLGQEKQQHLDHAFSVIREIAVMLLGQDQVDQITSLAYARLINPGQVIKKE